MGFKANTSFLKFLSIGAIGVRRVIDQLRSRGFEPVELERYCSSNKIWTTKVKRLRLPDLLCVKTGTRVEVRAKTDLKIRMSDSPTNPDRVWDAGLRDNDIVAFITCSNTGDCLQAADEAVYFTIKALRDSVDRSKLGSPKSASEGAERDRLWPATVPTRDGTVLEVRKKQLVVQMNADANRPTRRQTYTLGSKSAYVSPGDNFKAQTTILAGEPSELADLTTCLSHQYIPLDHLKSPYGVDRYAAVKALRFRDDPRDQIIPAIEDLIHQETEDRITLEAAGSAAFFESTLGQEQITRFVWGNEDRQDLRMETVFILAELGTNSFTRDQLNRIAEDTRFEGDEIRQAAVWALGKAGLKCYKDILPFIDDPDENLALHAICAFGTDTPRAVIESLAQDLITGDSRRATAASETLRIIASDDVLQVLVEAANSRHPTPDWIIATLGRLPPPLVQTHIKNSPLFDCIKPMLLFADGTNWLASETINTSISFLLKQNLA